MPESVKPATTPPADDPVKRARIAALRPRPRCSHCHAGLVLSNGCCDMCGRVTILPEDFASER